MKSGEICLDSYGLTTAIRNVDLQTEEVCMIIHFIYHNVHKIPIRIFVMFFCFTAFAVCEPPLLARDVNTDEQKAVATFSIVARDSLTGELGVGVASRFFAVGSVVPWAKAEVGAVATQSYANTSFGWRGLELLEKGKTPQEVERNLITPFQLG